MKYIQINNSIKAVIFLIHLNSGLVKIIFFINYTILIRIFSISSFYLHISDSNNVKKRLIKKIISWRQSRPWSQWSLGAGPLSSYTGPRQGKDTRALRIWGMWSSVGRNFARKFPMFYRKELSWNHHIQGWYLCVCVCECMYVYMFEWLLYDLKKL